MKVLLTGAFGNIGTSALEELLKKGHEVRCFDLRTKANEKIAKKYEGKIQVFWGDLRKPEDVAFAVHDRDVVIHLAFVIPKLSATGVGSEERPHWAREINVGGTRNLLQAMKALPHPPKIIFASSYHVYGRTQDQLPPRVVADPLHPVEHYARHKVACERMVKSSGLDWAIFRFAAALPVRLILDPGMFDVPLNNRIEFVYREDVGLALANALDTDEIWGRVWLIGGGPRCQYYYREIVEKVLDTVGIGMLPEEAFGTVPYSTDWLDTSESQRVLQFQRHTLDDYLQDVRKALGIRRFFVRLFRPLVRAWLLRRSPYYKRRKPSKPQVQEADSLT
ncbi:MAG: NAD(P)-dependent oxidoreductase [Anaerolineae bacterium]|nr:NAD(P)-dependent oxidoreductase [Anaerolineae bacterium]